MRKRLFLAITGLALLAGCGDMGNKPYESAVPAKYKPPYHLELATETPKPNPAGVTLPAISYKSDTKDWQRRAALVVRFDPSGAKNARPGKDRVILEAVDIAGTGGNLPSEYLDAAEQQLAKLLADRCIKGKVVINLALVRSSIRPDAEDAEINAKLLTDWLPAEVVFKNPHPKC